MGLEASQIKQIFNKKLRIKRKTRVINPLTPGNFCKKCVFWTFWWPLGWTSAKLPLIRWKMRLQHNSLPFLPPASRFSALWLGHAQKSKFWDTFWARKWSSSLGFSIFGIFFSPFLFLLFSCFCCSDCHELLLGLLVVNKLMRKRHRDG